MSNCIQDSAEYSFIIAIINTKIRSILTKTDYTTLMQSDTLEDVIIKLLSTPYQKYLNEEAIFSKKVFKTQLSKSLVFEIKEIKKQVSPKINILLDFYVNFYKIQNFIFLLSAKEHDPNLAQAFSKIEEVGKFNELETLKFANDMLEVYKFCVEHTFLKKYYRKVHIDNDINKNNFQVIQSQFMKFLIEDFYAQSKDFSEFITHILQCQGDRWIIEVVLNTLEDAEYVGRKRRDLFPNIFSFGRGLIFKLSICTDIDDLKGLLVKHHIFKDLVNVDKEDMETALLKIEMETYWESLYRANDVACVYAYLKIKEHEIKSILMAVECISMKKKDFVGKLITHVDEKDNN